MTPEGRAAILRKLAWLGAGCTAAGIAIAFAGWREVLEAARTARPLPLFVMIALLAGGAALRIVKWRIALGPGIPAAGLFFLAKNAGNWSPGRVGELAPLILREHRNVRVATWLVADRIVEAGFTLFFGALGLLYLYGAPPMAILVTCMAAAPVLLLAAGFAYAWQAPAAPPAWWPAGALAQRLYAMLAALHDEARRLRGSVAPIVLLTIGAKLADFYAVVALCAAYGYRVPILLAAAARCAHALVGAAPVTPDASGVPYLAQAWLLHSAAGMPLAVLAAALLLEAAAVNALLYAGFLVTAPGLRSATVRKDQAP